MFGLSVWSWCRGDGREAEAHPIRAAVLADSDGEGNHDEAAMRFRTNQSVHWRHVMVGNR
jgi:hypothetical protein